LVLTCLDGYDTLVDGRCFKFMERKSGTTYYYDSSVNACAKDGTRLATIKSQEENDQLLAAIRKKTTRPGDYGFFFIGLACDGEKLVWPDGSEANFTNFVKPYNCDANGKNHHFYVDYDMGWSQGSTENHDALLCEETGRSDDPCGEFDVFESGKSSSTCYSLQTKPASWLQAQSNCSKLSSFLSVIHDQSLNDFIRRTAVSNGLLDGVHIGFRENSGNYSWVDNSDTDFNNFVPGFPNDLFGECVAMETQSAPKHLSISPPRNPLDVQ
ncbi:hypothetical protein PFISCL1PPCAC_16901, partial [Pristionchus fissidentatus]